MPIVQDDLRAKSSILYRLLSKLRQYARFSVGRITGTTTAESGAYKQLLTAEEARLFHRVDINALTGLLIKKGVFTEEEWTDALIEEAKLKDKELAEEWPDITVASDGRSYTINLAKFQERCAREHWPP